MKRRMALTFAGTAAIVLTAGSAAVAANLGILGSANQEPVGQLDANSVAELSATTSTSIEPIVVTIDEIVPVPVETPPAAAPPVAGSSSGDSSGSGSSGGTAATTPTTARVDDSGPGSIDDDDDHSGSDDDHSDSDDDDHSGSDHDDDDD